MTITFATGCSGIGAPEMAFGDRLGWKCLWCSEIEPFPSAVLKYRWPDVPNVGDFLTIAERIRNDELEAPDVFIAGTPCQAFSVAGLRKSLKDHRGNLTLEYIRIANEMDEQRRRRGLPETVFVWENVPGVLFTEDNAFGCFLGGMLGLDNAVVTPDGHWNDYGSLVAYRTVAWRILDAQYFGVAQRRRRVFLIATARPGFSPARGLFEFGRVRRDTPPCRETRAASSADAEICAGETGEWWDGGGIADTITRTSNEMRMPDKNRLPCVIVHGTQDPITETERANAIGRNNGGENCLLENMICPALDASMYRKNQLEDIPKYEAVATSERLSHWDNPTNPHPTLGAIGTGVGASNQEVFAQRGSMLVASFLPDSAAAAADTIGYQEEQSPTLRAGTKSPGVVCYENNPTDARQKETDIAPTVLERWGTGGNQTPYVQTYSISENIIGREAQNGGNHLGVSDGPSFALNATGVSGVAQIGFVRRLTTVECARLQGFPDHHTEIPWRGKAPEECPKGPQYKAYGNSMCVNVIEWIGRQIEKELENPKPLTIYQPEQLEFDF